MRRDNFRLTPRIHKNPWGQHDRDRFLPSKAFPLRCPKCNNLFDPGFFDEGAPKCPNCNYVFRKAEARDAAVEAMQVNTVQKGYNERALDELGRLRGQSGYIGKQGAKPINPIALEMARVAEQKRRATAKRLAQMKKVFQNQPIPRQVA